MANGLGPSALMERYENLLISNLAVVPSIESGLRNVSWLLPGRFQDAELASEGLYALLNVVSGYHDSLLSKHLDPALSLPPHPFAAAGERDIPAPSKPSPISSSSDAGGPDPAAAPTVPRRTTPTLPPPSDHARYTKYWTARSGVYRKASRMLVTISYIELLVEMIAKKKLGDRRRWSVVLGMESVKTFLRFIILMVTKRPVLSHPAPQREYDLLSLPASVLQARPSGYPSTQPSSATYHDSHTGTHRDGSDAEEQIAAAPSGAITTTLPPFAPLRSHLFPLLGALPEDHLPHPLTLLPQLTPAQTVSEIIQSSVTLIHVILLLRAAPGKYSLPTLSRPLAPFVVPLALSLLARYLRQTSSSKTVLQSEHNAGRDRQLAMRTFVTGPMWIGWTRPKIMGIVKTLERIPLVGLVGDLVEGYIPLVDEYFYYSS